MTSELEPAKKAVFRQILAYSLVLNHNFALKEVPKNI